MRDLRMMLMSMLQAGATETVASRLFGRTAFVADDANDFLLLLLGTMLVTPVFSKIMKACSGLGASPGAFGL